MKVVIIAGNDRSLINFRVPLIRALVARGHEVVACAPAEAPEVPEQLGALGARFVAVPIHRTGLNPLVDLFTFVRLRNRLVMERPDAVLSYTIKPVIYGSLAAASARVQGIYALVTGLGTAFADQGSRGLRFAATALYRQAFRRCRIVFSQNPDITSFFLESRIARSDQIVTVRGSGVDLAHFRFVPIREEGAPSFLMLTRLLRDKGVFEYVEAARRVKARYPEAIFKLVGPTDPNPTGISLDTVFRWHSEGVIDYVPYQSDVRSLLAACKVFVLPSYHEGLPKAVLEAMAVGRPIVTTDAIGCRETVKGADRAAAKTEAARGENGFLVPVRSVAALAEAMKALAADLSLVRQMGQRSREIAESDFDAEKISREMIAAMAL